MVMGLFDKLRGELIDIIEWVDDNRNTLVWRFPRYQNEVKNGAQLIVRPGQMAIFVHRGQVADVFEPGNYELKADNLPILSTIMGWKYGFNSPFRSEVYFVSTRQITDLKWGTPNPIMLRDPEFGPIRLRAFGTYAIRAAEPRALLKELVGTDGEVGADEVSELMRSMIISTFADMLGESKLAALDIASNYRDLGEKLRRAVHEKIDDEYGLELPQLFIVNVSFPEEVEKALDKRTSMGVIGDMQKFQQFQMGQAMTIAAENPSGGAAAAGLGAGMGFAMANQMAAGLARPAPVASPVAPPPLPTEAWHIAIDGQTRGPFTMTQIADGIATGQVGAGTLVWSASLPGWTAANQVSQFAGRFAAVPPPPPAAR
jgi:membrane protease subunit (stomatin/prohibitin family)